MARRTFVGNLYKQVLDPNIVASMSGHAEGSSAFSRYREIDREIKANAVNLLDCLRQVREQSDMRENGT